MNEFRVTWIHLFYQGTWEGHKDFKSYDEAYHWACYNVAGSWHIFEKKGEKYVHRFTHKESFCSVADGRTKEVT